MMNELLRLARENAGVLTVLTAVLGGTWYLASELAKKADSAAVTGLTVSANNLSGDVERVSGIVDELQETVTPLTNLGEAVNGLTMAVRQLTTSVGDLEDARLLLAMCVIDLHGPWEPPRGGAADGNELRRVPQATARVPLPSPCLRIRQQYVLGQ